MADTRWVWIYVDESWVLAFSYVDPQAGPSAKGAVIREPITPEQITYAVDTPDRTFRDPISFRAMPIGAEDALRLGLPKDPPWIGIFEGKPIPPPRGQPSRVVTALVTRGGRPVANARVRMGSCIGAARELIELDTRTTDASGRCEFPLAPMTPVSAIADIQGASSKLVDIPDASAVELELMSGGAIEGEIRQNGQLVAGSVSLTGMTGGVHKVKRTNAQGFYRIDGIVPDTYGVEVESIDPNTKMTAGTPTLDTVTIGEGQTLRRDYVLVAGAAVRIVIAVEKNDAFAEVILFSGSVSPRTKPELTELWKGRDKSTYRSANSMRNDGKTLRTELADVLPGRYTLCVCRSDHRGEGHREQPVVSTTIEVGSAPVTVELALLPLRPR